MNLEDDLREFVELLNALNVHYLVVGGFAVAYYGYARFTADLDLFVERSQENAARLVQVVERFGFGDLNLSPDDFLKEDQVIQLGVSPNRIDLLTFISAVDFQEAWAARQEADIQGVNVPMISKEMLKRNKAATGRTQDLLDLERLS